MRTDSLITSLAGDLRAVPRGVVPRRLTLGLVGGAAVTMALILSWLGLRPDLAYAARGFPFWMKWGYTISISVIGVMAMMDLARPEADRSRRLWWLALPVGLLGALALRQLLITPADDWTALWQGQSWHVCSIKVATLSLPILAGYMLAFRAFAPTRLRLTGAVAGLSAGACAATFYGLHCPEASALFIFVWYSLGMMAAGAIGALTAPKLLRW